MPRAPFVADVAARAKLMNLFEPGARSNSCNAACCALLMQCAATA